ncbi:effector-binding domain-containing protein [Tenacibaculum adriaticum]|uniref:Effector-binding domain-containing protein n=1 Tax=Tenacibaculum adriaticum TaxID=413713 RepID=A0A5S5DTX8_9FLAO|nr:GyrI-like domain-containing protein [Tenacibaculum adriaticum]TYP99410.1 effector-binding domain-containing protein [Tenacibaculum adriaticum]
MKFFKYLLLLSLTLLVIGLLYVSIQSGNYEVSRTKLMKYPVYSVFNIVNDLKTWEKWGPWHDEDSTIMVTYADKTVGVGASNRWTSKDGSGSIKTVSIIENKRIVQEIRFGDNEPSDVLWDFEKIAEGTKVTWTMKDDKAPFIFKVFSTLSGGWENMLGPMLDKGLNNLDEVVKSQPLKYSLGEVKIIENQDKIFLGFPYKMKIDYAEIQKVFADAMPKVIDYAIQSGLKYAEFTPGALYHKWDQIKGETEFHIGILIEKNIKPREDMEIIKVTGGKNVMITKCGNYNEGDYEAHMAIDTYLKVNNLISKWPIYELYVNDPTQVKQEDIQTDIYYPLQ